MLQLLVELLALSVSHRGKRINVKSAKLLQKLSTGKAVLQVPVNQFLISCG
jgi:hypothetical protein